MLVNHLTFSSTDSYQKVIEQNLDSPNNDFDLTQFTKMALFKIKIQDAQTEFRDMMLKPVPRVDRYFLDETGNLASDSRATFAFEHDSKASKVVKAVQFANLLYISFTCPLTIGFAIYANPTIMALDVLSLLISFAVIIFNLRTYIIIKGRKTLEFKQVLQNYWHKGLLIDLFGIVPFKLGLFSKEVDRDLSSVLILSFLGLVRMISVWRTMELIQEFEVYVHRASYYFRLSKAVLMFYLPGHWLACAWYFLCAVIERGKTNSWIYQQNLQNQSILDCYIRSYYLTINIATSVGSGDMYPNTELERFGVTLMMTVGDVLWSFGFGLII